MDLLMLQDRLFKAYIKAAGGFSIEITNRIEDTEFPVDYFKFYKSVSAVCSSKIEGEKIDFESYFMHKLVKIRFKPDYTHKVDDLFTAYYFVDRHISNQVL